MVRSRPNGSDHFFWLCRRKNELDVLRWFFNNLEERVESLLRDHVRLIEDVNLVTVPRRGKAGALAQVTSIVDTVVARGVDLDDVN
ncbi:unannotated protein [freshwater metagenome]|uniref:Unannotated protein n=1 Tax=freshwater metagenome TaxID=449393 RepID=A0A6J6G9H5_9ZZZZ